MAAEIELERSLKDGVGSAATGSGSVPVIDLEAEDAEQLLWEAARDVGFFSVVNHGVDMALVDSAFACGAAFFAQPVEAKKQQSPFEASANSGFESYSQVRPSTGTPDQKESLQMTARLGAMDGRWPTEPADLRSTAEALTAEAHALACRIMSMLERRACSHLAPGTLARAHSLWASPDGQCTLRLLHYPPMTKEVLRALKSGPAPHWRAGPHTDWCNVTLLFQREGQGGLECRANPRNATTDGAAPWVAVPPVAAGIAINIGDMLARWSDGHLFSNLHRVRMPTEDQCERPRYSIAFFAQADKSALIESKDSEPITAGDYLQMRIKSNFAAKKK